MPTWPAGLPQNLEIDEYDETFAEASVETNMETGPPKKRARFTAGIQPITGRQLLTKAQVATLKTFYDTTTKFGSLSFDWTHPRTGSAAVLRFASAPKIQVVGPDAWYARMSFKVLP